MVLMQTPEGRMHGRGIHMETAAEMYHEAIAMALNTYKDNVLARTVDWEKDTWEVGILEDDGIYYITITGEYVRSCYKWLRKGGKPWTMR
jgi:hypothetical protein